MNQNGTAASANQPQDRGEFIHYTYQRFQHLTQPLRRHQQQHTANAANITTIQHALALAQQDSQVMETMPSEAT